MVIYSQKKTRRIQAKPDKLHHKLDRQIQASLPRLRKSLQLSKRTIYAVKVSPVHSSHLADVGASLAGGATVGFSVLLIVFFSFLVFS